MSENSTESGFLVLADISGYTTFLTETELEHGPAVVKDLLDAVVAAMVPPFEIEGLQGDCVFALGRDDATGKASYLLDVLEGVYIAFRAHQRQMMLSTTCHCAACKGIPSLNLKILAHYGRFVRQSLGVRTQIAGPDVITAHRLLKNSVKDMAAYLLITKAAVERTYVDPGDNDCSEHEENYEDVGKVACYVKGLEPVWQAAEAVNVIRVKESEQMALTDVMLPVPPPIAWDWICTPERRLEYEPAVLATQSVRESNPQGGRAGVGTHIHCAHGEQAWELIIHDWHPFDYHTMQANSAGLPPLLCTTEFHPQGEGTRVIRRFGPLPDQGFIARWKLRRGLPQLAAGWTAAWEHLAERLAQQADPEPLEAERDLV